MSAIQTISKQYSLHTKLFNNVLEDIDNNKGSERLNDHVNHLQWIAGHLTNSRYSIAPIIGLKMPFPYWEIYTDLTAPPPHNRAVDTTIEYPSLTEIKKYWNSLSEPLIGKLSHLENGQLASASPFAVPTGKTILDLLSFIASHESYHIGQMSIIRKYLGKEAMSYN
jgi:uncharacterized damage-inducible protein DinB